MASDSRYSHHVRRALSHAKTLARGFSHPHMDTAHLLVGVMLSEGSVGAQVMQDLDLPADVAAVYLKRLLTPVERAPDPMPYAPPLVKALEQSISESTWLGNHYVGTEHLLLGITRMNLGNVTALLRLVDITPEQIRRRVRNFLSSGYTEFNLDDARANYRMSELSRRILNGAERLAHTLGHPAVGLGHLLLALSQERRGVTSGFLHQSGLREEVLLAGLYEHDSNALLSIDTVIMPAIDQAEKLGSHYLGADHLLLALTMVEPGIRLMHTYGINPEKVNRLLSKHLRGD